MGALPKTNDTGIIPDAAIEASEEAKRQIVRTAEGKLKASKNTGNPKDPYSEEKVSLREPKVEGVRSPAPDTTVFPG